MTSVQLSKTAIAAYLLLSLTLAPSSANAHEGAPHAPDRTNNQTHTAPTTAAVTDRAGASLRISPALVEPKAKPGSSSSQIITLTNATNRPISIQVLSESLARTSTESNELTDASLWITIDKKVLRLAPKEVTKVTATFSVPTKASPGGAYASVIFQATDPNAKQDESTSQSVGRVGVSVLGTVLGPIEEKLTVIKQLRESVEDGNLVVRGVVRNDGVTHVLATAFGTASPWIGSTKSFTSPSAIILPKEQREFVISTVPVKAANRISVTMRVKYSAGKYVVFHKQTYFLLSPALRIFTLLALLGAIAGTVFYILRRKQRSPNK